MQSARFWLGSGEWVRTADTPGMKQYGDVILTQVFDEVFFRHARDLGTIPYSAI